MFSLSIKKYCLPLIFTFLIIGGVFFAGDRFYPEVKKIELSLFEGPGNDSVFGSPVGACGGSCPCGETCTGGKFPTCTCDSCVAVVASLFASPTSIDFGDSSTLTWSSSGDVSSCSGSGFSTGGATSGSTDVSPSVDTTYFLTCTGPGGSDGDTADVDVSNPSAPPEIDADPDRVERGDTTSLSWDTNGHLGCSISGTNGDSFDPEVVSSPQTTGEVFGETTFTILCTDDSSSDDVDVTIIPEFEEF